MENESCNLGRGRSGMRRNFGSHKLRCPRRVDEGCRTGHFNSNNRLDLGRGKGKSDRVIDEGYNGP